MGAGWHTRPSAPKSTTPQEIIRHFTAKEKEWKQVREQYTFQQSLEVQEIVGTDVRSDYRQVSDISYNGGKRIKSVVLAPQASLDLTKEDVEDLEVRATFTISSDELPTYNLTYAGSQKVDDLHCYVFDVVPKTSKTGTATFKDGSGWTIRIFRL